MISGQVVSKLAAMALNQVVRVGENMTPWKKHNVVYYCSISNGGIVLIQGWLCMGDIDAPKMLLSIISCTR